jgi:hypothetical protein
MGGLVEGKGRFHLPCEPTRSTLNIIWSWEGLKARAFPPPGPPGPLSLFLSLSLSLSHSLHLSHSLSLTHTLSLQHHLPHDPELKAPLAAALCTLVELLLNSGQDLPAVEAECEALLQQAAAVDAGSPEPLQVRARDGLLESRISGS